MKLKRCHGCNRITADALLLRGISPFDQSELFGCPHCKQCDEGFSLICDEPGCDQASDCGWPTSGGGYRHTCGKHYKRQTK